jgi:sugar phosphate isomerase/epimerase
MPPLGMLLPEVSKMRLKDEAAMVKCRNNSEEIHHLPLYFLRNNYSDKGRYKRYMETEADRIARKKKMYKWEFSIAPHTLPNCSPEELIYVAARTGYNYVSLWPIHCGIPNEPFFDLAGDSLLLKKTVQALRSTDLKILDIELVRIVEGFDANACLPTLEIAAELDVKHLLCSIWTDNNHFVLNSLERFCDIARRFHMTVNIEFVTWSACPGIKEALGIIKQLSADNCGIMIDTLHFHRSRVQLSEIDLIPSEYFHFVHICDAPAKIPATVDEMTFTAREERLYLGEGGIDVAGILKKLPPVVYGIELPHAKRVKKYGYEEHARQCLETAKKYLTEQLD